MARGSLLTSQKTETVVFIFTNALGMGMVWMRGNFLRALGGDGAFVERDFAKVCAVTRHDAAAVGTWREGYVYVVCLWSSYLGVL